MVNVSPESVESLKYILENSLRPECLDSHPWTSSSIMQEVDGAQHPGPRLVLAVGRLFTQMMPSTPVKRGKRLDSRWAEFGILAALYFAPIEFGTPSPGSLREAWGRIDQSILYFVYGKKQDELSEAEINAYKLVGDEPEVASISTLSDWHRKGLQRLADLIQTREHYLVKSTSEVPVSSSGASSKKQSSRRASKARGLVVLALVMLLLGSLVVGGLKARRVYNLARIVRQDAQAVQSVMTRDTPRLERVREAGPALAALRRDFNTLKAEVAPYLWIGPWLDWVPTYGGDLAAAPDLVTLADSLLATAESSYQAVLPIAEKNDQAGFDLPLLTQELL
ncbi:MAG TPA: hypothetical protein VLE49_04115, partial [Anaerolineales bacterium]|nr:hypothetical protein [Anaerolineales bacterium]